MSFWAIISNPAARKASRQKFEAAVKLLGSAGHKTVLYESTRKGDSTGLAARAAAEGASLIIAAGGDGTFNEVMNGIPPGLPMALLPVGTTNVLAKELGIPEDVEGAVKTILAGKSRDVFVGRMDFISGAEGTRKFFMMAGVGFDAAAVYGVHKKFKKLSGKIAYVLSGLKLLPGWKPGPLLVRAGGGLYHASGVIVCKGARYGGSVKAAPEASLSEPYLYAVIMHGFGRRHPIKYALGILAGCHTGFKDVSYLKCTRLEIDGRARVQADGDYIGLSPVVISVAPGTIRIIC